MGYAADYFEGRVRGWIDAGWLPLPGRLVDFGAQEFQGDSDEARRSVRDFLSHFGVANHQIDVICSAPGSLNIARIYRIIGVNYVALDTHRAKGVTDFDLNCFAPPTELVGRVDLVNNEGAIEHLINPVNGFQVAHELLKVGGVAAHSIPLAGHTNHGLMYPTLKFYNRLIAANNYELLLSEISIGRSQPHTDTRFILRDRHGRPFERRVDYFNAWLHFGYRKTSAAEFRCPFSHWADDQSGPLADRINADYAAFAGHRLTDRRGTSTAGTGGRQLPIAVLPEPMGDEPMREDQTYSQRTGLYLSSLAITLTSLANGGALLIDLQRGSPAASWLFAVGLLSGFFPIVTAWTDIGEGPSRLKRLVRYGSRLLWLASAVLFVAGCLVAGSA
jgi:hypothetical protein